MAAIALRLNFKETRPVLTLLDFSSFLYDFTLLHDCAILAVLPNYKEYRFSQYFWYRKGRPLLPEHQLLVRKVSHQSPLLLETVLTATAVTAGAVWAVVQAIDKIKNWRLNRQILTAQLDNLLIDRENKRTELQNNKLQVRLKEIEIEQNLERNEGTHTFAQIVRRIEEHPFEATDAEFIEINEQEVDTSNKKKADN
jgi:hypothetical protein